MKNALESLESFFWGFAIGFVAIQVALLFLGALR
jgi:hypothetical protein